VFVPASIPIWILYSRAFEALRKSPFGYELGSVAYPIPPRLEAIRISALACLIIGTFLLLREVIQWLSQRRHD